MSVEQANPSILVAPSRQEIEVFDPSLPDGVRLESELSLKLDLHEYANIIGFLATKGVGSYKNIEVAVACNVSTKGIGGQRAKFIAQLFPEYISCDRGFQVLQDFSVAIAPEQPGDAAIIRSKKRAANEENSRKKREARQQHIASLEEQLDQLVTEATYSPEDIERQDSNKINLYDYDSVRFNVAGLDHVIPLIGPEDMICARLLIDLGFSDDPKLGVYANTDMIQRVWEAMPNRERELFANTYRGKVPSTFTRMFSTIATEVGLNPIFLMKSGHGYVQSMRPIDTIRLLDEEPNDDDYTEFAVRRFDTTDYADERQKIWREDKVKRQKVISELRSLGVYYEDQIRPLQQKAKLQYTPEAQLELKAPLTELLTSILSGELESLTQPQAMEVIYAANNTRFYRSIEKLGSTMESSFSLDAAVEKLNEAARVGLGDSYHGFATRDHTIGRATIKRLHRR